MAEFEANFTLNNEQNIDALFEIYASGTTWGNISGTLSNQEDLQEALDSKASNERVDGIVASFDNDIEEINTNISDLQTTVSDNYSELNTKIQNETVTRTENDNLLQGDINTLSDNLTAEISNRENADSGLQTQITNLTGTVSSNYSILDNKIDSVESDLQGNIDTLENAVDTNAGNISTLNTTVSNLNTTVQSNYTILDTKIDTAQTTLQGNIDTLSGTVTSNYNDLTQSITNNVSTLNTRITNEVSTLNGSISDEATARANADNNLQTQIDAIVSSSDVFDIVGTYAELEAYDISTVPVNDIIKVLVDSTHNNAATYYRCVENAGVKSWNYIGSEGAYYTKGEADSTFVPQTRTINNKQLNQNINLTASDVGALPVGTQIGNGTILLTQGGVQKGTFTLNQTGDATIDFDAGGSTITVDSELSTSSENPVQNKVITNALNSKVNSSALASVALSGDYDDLINKPTIPTKTSELTNDSNFITGIDSSDITSALGYVPYDSTNPSGYTANVGTVTSVNNTSPDSNGNVALNIPTVNNGTITINQGGTLKGTFTVNQSGDTTINLDQGGTVDQTFDGTSANAQSGVAINGAGFLKNTATGENSLILLGDFNYEQSVISIGAHSTTARAGVAIGAWASGKNWGVACGTMATAVGNSVAIGGKAQSTGGFSIAIGGAGNNSGIDVYTEANARGAIQIGAGTNSTANSFNVGFCNTVNSNANYQLLDGTTGLIPNARLNTLVGADGTNAGVEGIVPAPTATDNTKFLKGDGTWADAGSSRNIGEIITSTLPLTDTGLHLLDGALIDGSGIYADFVDYISSLDLTANYFCTEAEWQQSVTDYGVCGKFVYDSTNNTVRLPKITGILDGTTDVTALGDLVEAGLPNITGDLSTRSNTSNTGAFTTKTLATSIDGGATTLGTSFDASRSSSIYGNSSTVQPQTIKAFYYIVIATSTKTDIQVDIDEIATDLNGKVDISDLAEVQCVVETYQNGTSWYRIWSDGWCEQGGYSSSISSTTTITFLRSFATTDYTVIVTWWHTSNVATYAPIVNNESKTQFEIFHNGNGAQSVGQYWQACGYIEV